MVKGVLSCVGLCLLGSFVRYLKGSLHEMSGFLRGRRWKKGRGAGPLWRASPGRATWGRGPQTHDAVASSVLRSSSAVGRVVSSRLCSTVAKRRFRGTPRDVHHKGDCKREMIGVVLC